MIKKFIMLLCLLLIITGCEQDRQVLKVATGNTGGAYYPIGSTFAEVLSDQMDGYIFNAYVGQASVSNVRLIKEGDVDFAIVQSNVSNWANKGLGMFEADPVDNLAGITSLYPEVIQIIVSKASGIDSIDDLKGKRISIGLEESGNYFDALNILDAHNIGLEDFNPQYLSFGQAIEAMEQETIEGAFITSGVPTASVIVMDATMEIEFLSISEPVLNKLIDKYPYYASYDLKKESYGRLKYDVKTISTPALLLCDKDLDEDLVYEITKTFFDTIDLVKASHPSMENFLQENYKSGMSIPLHAGAERYYNEKNKD